MIEDVRLRRTALVVAILVVAGIITAIEHSGNKSSVPAPASNLPSSEGGLAGAPDFAGATGWLNTPDNASLDIVALRGKVVFVDFWTYSCINCIHTLPHLTKLYDTYRDHGLVVVGAHSPEFAFETKRDNVQDAIERYGIHYPVAQDNDYGIWDAYGNHYWPAHYLVDQYGKLRGSHFGEGGYEDTEKEVRGLLQEAGYTDLPTPIEPLGDVGGGSHSPELYATSGRSAIGNPEGYHEGRDVDYSFPSSPQADRIYLDGSWRDSYDSVDSLGPAAIEVRFHGAAANVVLGGPDGACVEVLLDGAPIPMDRAARDVTIEASRSCLVLDGERSYDVYDGPREDHLLELKVPQGSSLFTFDFT